MTGEESTSIQWIKQSSGAVVRSTDSSFFSYFSDVLRDKVEFDQTALMEIQLALYVFQEAVSMHDFLTYHISSDIRRIFFLPKQSQRSRSIL